jgi:acyl transferase domain-containing protein/thioesterase domain-containing protein/phosphopantetheinyl transferase/acyl carrier protein
MSSETRFTGLKDIAIIGMSTLLPKAPDTRQFWQNLNDKVDGVTEGHPDWVQHFYDPEMTEAARIYTKKGGFLDRETRFDPLEFGIMPSTIDGTTPDHFLAMKACKEAMVDAGYWDNPKWDKTRTGVILGYGPNANRGNLVAFQHGLVVDQTLAIVKAMLPDIEDDLLLEIRRDIESGLPPLRPEIVPGFVANVLTGRIANRLDLMGPNYIVDAACSASFISLDAAMNELQSGRSDLMLAGGVNCSMPPQMMMVFSIIEALTREKVRPFDKNASGVILGEGLGVFVLKRLEEAERDGDRIYAVIKGLSLASDGKSKGLLAPRLEGEILAMERTYEECGIDRNTISLIEAHGTGIPLGDGTEVKSLKSIFGDRPEDGLKIGLGGVKSMLGHSLMAAGSAGMIKTVLGLYHKVLPPTLCNEVNPDLELEDSPIYVNNEPRPWVHGESHPRRAGVNAFGFGGIDGHCVVEEYTGPGSENYKLLDKEWPHELMLFHGKTQEEVLARVEDIIGVIEHANKMLLRDIAYSLMKDADGAFGQIRLAVIIGRDREEAVTKLRDAIEKVKSGKAKRLKGRGGIFFGDEVREGKLAFIYPGHGAQYPEMMSQLARFFPQVREWFDVLDHQFVTEMGIRPSEALYPPPTVLTPEQRAEKAKELFTGDYSIALTNYTADAMDELVRKTLGVKPDVMLGHSTGELNAVGNSGYFKKPGKFELSETTNNLVEVFTGSRDELGGLPTGALLTVGAADHKVVEQIVNDSKGKLAFVLDNCPNQVLLYGTEKDILEAKPKFEKAGGICERMPFDRAFHTPDFKLVSDRMAEKFDESWFGEGETKLYSATKGDYYPSDSKTVHRWCSDLWSEPVMFRGAIERLYEDGVRFFVEVGASSNLTAFVNDTLMGKDYLAVATNNARKGDLEQVNTMLAQLFVNGRNPRFEGMYEHREVNEVPTHPEDIVLIKRRPTDQVLVRDVATMRISEAMLKKLEERFPDRGLHAISAALGASKQGAINAIQDVDVPVPPTPAVSENGQPQMPTQPMDPNLIPNGQPQFDPYAQPPQNPAMMPPQVDQWGNPLPPQQPQQFDAYGNPIPPQPPVDAWGNPIPPVPAYPPQQQFDAYGNPIPMVDQWGNPLPPQQFDAYGNPIPQLDQWGNPIPPQQLWGPDFFAGGSPGGAPPPAGFDAYGNPVDAWGNLIPHPPMVDEWGNPLPPFDPNLAPPVPFDPYAQPVQEMPAAPAPPMEPMPIEPAAAVEEAPAPVVAIPEAVAEPVQEVPAPVAPAVDPKDLPYGKKPAMSHEQLMAQLADPSIPDAPEHMLRRFDPELAVNSDAFPRPEMNGLPFDRAYPMLGDIIQQDENLLECERHLSVEKDLVLKSHAFGGPPSRHQKDLHPMAIVPFVMSLETCAEAARCLMDGKKFAKSFKNIRGHRWLALPQGTLDIMIKAKKLKDLDGGDTLVRTEIYQYHKQKDGTIEPHLTFEAMIVVGDQENEAVAPMPFKVKDPKYSHLTTEMLYNDGIFYSMNYPGRFHGRHFRAIRKINHYSAHTIEVEMEVPDWDDLFANIENPQFQTDMFIMDGAVLQVGFYYTDVYAMDANLFPFLIKEIKLFGGPPPPGRKIIGRAAMRMTGIGDIDLDSNPYFDFLDKDGNVIFQMDENSEEGFSFPKEYYKAIMQPNLGCLEGTVDLLDAETGHVYAHIIGWQNRYFDMPIRFDKVTLFPYDFTLSEPWMAEETGYRMRMNEPFHDGLLEGSWGVWGSKLAHTMLTKNEQNEYYSFAEGSARREDWLMGRIAAKEVLTDWIQEHTDLGRLNPIDVEIRHSDAGSPYGICVVDESITLPKISISHASRAGLAVTSDDDTPIGVDYECLDGFIYDDVLAGGFSDQDLEKIKTLPESDQRNATAALWCGKEAVSKMLGTGLNHEPREWVVASFDMDAGRATIVYKEESVQTRFWFSDSNEVVAICKRGNGHTSNNEDDSESDQTTTETQTSDAGSADVSTSAPEAESPSEPKAEIAYAMTVPFDSSEPVQDEENIDWDDPDRAPTELEEELIELWEELLDVDDVGLHDDFFDLGGESVLAVRLIGQVEKKMNRSIPVANFLKTRTIAQMARILSDKDWKPDWSSLVPMRVTGERTPLFFTHPVGGNVLKYRELISFIPEEQPLYALQARGLDGEEEPFDNVPEMAAYYLKGIRSAQEKGPYLLAGFSGGGVISWEMAYQLEQAGEEVALLALFDTFGPDYYTFEMGGSRLPHQLETFIWRFQLHFETMATLSLKEKIAYLQRKLKHGNRKSRGGSGGTIRKVEDVTYEAVLSYKPKKLDKVPVALFKASHQPKQSSGDEQLNWGPYVGDGNLEMLPVHGTHGHLVEQPHVDGLAKSLNEVLDRTHARIKS